MNHRSGLIDVRRFVAIAFAVLMAFAVTAAATAHSADARKKSKKAKVSLTVTTKNQAALLKANKLTVKVRSTAKTAVRVSAVQAGKANRFKARTVKFRKKGTRIVALRLTANGRNALKTCGAKVVVAKGVYRKGKRKAKTQRKKALAKDSTRCVTPPKPVTPVKSICDPLDPKVCMQPWPSNFYTKSASTPTGVQLDIPLEAMPKNRLGDPINLPDINRADGFSPGNLIVTKIPEVQTPAAFTNSGIVPITDLEKFDDPTQAVVVIDTATGERQPIWAELDSNPTTKSTVTLTPGQPPVAVPGSSINNDPTNTGDVNLIIRAAKNYLPGHRYVVAIRNLRNDANAPVEAAAPFRQCRDDAASIDDPALLYRCDQLNDKVFPALAANGIAKDGLYLAWDFTVASQESLTGRMLEIRDDAFSRLGDTNLADRKIAGNTPDVQITSFCDLDDTATAQCGDGAGKSPVPPSGVQRYVDGIINDSPCYLDTNGCATGAQFNFDSAGKITWNNTFTVDVPFRCLVPQSTVAGGTVHPAKTGIYGHGLLGTLNQVRGQNALANRQNSIWCATNFDGFADNDFSTVAASLKDLSNFNKLTDRMQQGFVNFMMLGRAALHEDGMADDPAFQLDPDGAGGVPASSVIDTSGGINQRGYYHGVSQGGIMGGALTAVDPDVDKGILNVPGINYSTLLSRSVDFDEYAHGIISDLYLPNVGLYDNYPNQAELPMVFSIMQLLWDRGEGNGYVQAMNPANPNLPNTNPHRVLLQPAYGDHQVANVAAEVEARTLGATSHAPILPNGRHWSENPTFGLNAQFGPISTGNNIMVYYDGGPENYNCSAPDTPVGCRGQGSKNPPNENVPPRPEWGYGGDPHGYPRAAEDGMQQAEDFLDSAQIEDCTAVIQFCFSNGYTGTP